MLEVIKIQNDVDNIGVVIDQPLVTVTVTNRRFGIEATGHAKWNPEDKWNRTFGIDLAYARALNRVSRKIEKHLVKKSNTGGVGIEWG